MEDEKGATRKTKTMERRWKEVERGKSGTIEGGDASSGERSVAEGKKTKGDLKGMGGLSTWGSSLDETRER